jgi:bla regulator protein blaR1
MRITATFIVVWTLAAAAQQPAPSFEVTSVKPNNSGAIEQSGVMGKGTLTMTNMRLRAVMTTAYATRPDRIIGLPSWTDQERFDLAARAPANTPDNQLPLMLRSLLVERFGLVIRPEMREQPVYALVMARRDGAPRPNLKPSTECATTRDASARGR